MKEILDASFELPLELAGFSYNELVQLSFVLESKALSFEKALSILQEVQ